MEGDRFNMTLPLSACSADHVPDGVRQRVIQVTPLVTAFAHRIMLIWCRYSVQHILHSTTGHHMSSAVGAEKGTSAVQALFEGQDHPEDSKHEILVKHNRSLGYLIVDLTKLMSGEQLQNLTVDFRKLHSAASSEEVLGVAVTAWTGDTFKRMIWHLIEARIYPCWCCIPTLCSCMATFEACFRQAITASLPTEAALPE